MSNDIKIDFSGLYNQDPTNLKIFDNDYLNNAEKYANIGKFRHWKSRKKVL